MTGAVDSGAPPAAGALSVVEYTDPACPWAWGSEPKFRELRARLAASGLDVAWRRVFGILFDEGEPPAPDPAAEAAWYLAELREIAGHTGAPVPERLRWVSATSWPASLAAKAAEEQGPEVADAVLTRLRETTFVHGTPADTPERVLDALRGLDDIGLDIDALALATASERVREAVRADWAETRSPCAGVMTITGPGRHNGRAKPLGEDPADGFRYALPTLILRGAAGRAVVPGWRPLEQYLDAVRAATGAELSR